MKPELFRLLSSYAPAFTTNRGMAFCGDSTELMKKLPDECIDLIVTSPPFALVFKKEYGNPDQSEYVSWFINSFGRELYRILKPTGSLVIDLGGAYQKGMPVRSLTHFELMIALVKEVGFFLAQEFYWYNPAKMPAPAEWVGYSETNSCAGFC